MKDDRQKMIIECEVKKLYRENLKRSLTFSENVGICFRCQLKNKNSEYMSQEFLGKILSKKG